MGVYKCPVCEGKGQVPAGFYYTNAAPTVINTSPELCKSCGGKGIVFDAEMFSNSYYETFLPQTLTFVAKGTCSNCGNNDGMVYTSNPPKWKCKLDNKWHTADYRCEDWCEQQQIYLQGKPVMGEWPCTTNCRLNATGTEDTAIEGLTRSNTTD